ncbi:MAG TPA: hypothetical protein VER03_04960 [Bryobacteraceae bacterium]|nr:hypothetical protein [Bryobacteraceae bacterium]
MSLYYVSFTLSDDASLTFNYEWDVTLVNPGLPVSSSDPEGSIAQFSYSLAI